MFISKLSTHRVGIALTFAVSLAFGNTAMAQSEDDDDAVDEIVVTSTKGGPALLQDVPTSIGVLTGEDIRKMGTVNLDDIARTIVGLDVVNRGVGDSSIVIRGINAEGESSAAIIWDNMPTAGSGEDSSDLGRRQFDLEVYDVEQVEVLRGPQGTLYGANSLTGVVRFVTAKPDLDNMAAEIVVGAVDVDEGASGSNQRGYINVPIVEGKVAARLVGYYRDEPGFIDAVQYPSPEPWIPDTELFGIEAEDINGYERSGFRFSLAADMGDTDILLQLFEQNTESKSGPIDRPVDSSIGPLQFPAQGDYKTLKTGHDVTDEDLTMFGFTLTHEFDNDGILTFATSTGDKRTDLDADLTGLVNLMRALVGRPRAVGNDAGCFAPNSPEALALPLEQDSDGVFRAPFPAVCRVGAGDGAQGGIFRSSTDLELRSTEIRYASNNPGRFNYIVGAVSQKRTIDVHNLMLETDQSSGVVLPITASNSIMFERTASFEMKTLAAFGQGTFNITDRFDMTLGGRFFRTEKEDGGISLIPFFQGVSNPVPADLATYDESDSIFKLEAAWRPVDDILVYAVIGQGFRSGGAVNQILPQMPTSFDHDETTNYEIGTKTTWFDGALVANLSLYQIEFTDMQYSVDYDGGAFAAQVNCSGQCATATGAELELNGQVGDAFTWYANYAYNKAEIDQDLPGSGEPDFISGDPSDFVALEGDPLITRVPENSYSLGGQFTFGVGSRNMYIRADVQHTGDVERTSNLRNPDGTLSGNVEMPAFTTAHAKIGLASDSWDANLFVRNLTNEVGAVFQEPTGTPALATRTVISPRQVGLQFTWHTN